MNIMIIEPYFTGSHAAWAKGYQKVSRHKIEILSMDGRYWKWRMHGGAVTLAKKFLAGNYRPDLILATDMLDLTTFLSLTRKETANIPTAIYFHENQITYPWSPDDRDIHHKRDKHYGFVNYASALAADRVFFNSCYHLESFLGELIPFLKHFPDHNELDTIETIREKSGVLPLGLDLQKLELSKPQTLKRGEAPPLILWNHRWEYDKNPAGFFEALYRLDKKNLPFEVALLGENFRKQPKEFADAKRRLGNKVVHYGFVKDFSDYATWLWRADLMPVTSNQDFFGGSVVEAIFCNTFPLLPKRLAYPEHIPAKRQGEFFYDDADDLVRRLEEAINNIDIIRATDVAHFVDEYRWEKMGTVYDETLSHLLT